MTSPSGLEPNHERDLRHLSDGACVCTSTLGEEVRGVSGFVCLQVRAMGECEHGVQVVVAARAQFDEMHFQSVIPLRA